MNLNQLAGSTLAPASIVKEQPDLVRLLDQVVVANLDVAREAKLQINAILSNLCSAAEALLGGDLTAKIFGADTVPHQQPAPPVPEGFINRALFGYEQVRWEVGDLRERLAQVVEVTNRFRESVSHGNRVNGTF